MSVEAISWALNLAPAPADRSGQPSAACKFVLVGLANHAGPDGTGAFPLVATLVRYTGLSERTVRTCLHRLAAEGIIRPCDPDIVAARIKRADRRPQGWDLNLSLVRDDLGEPGVAAPDIQSPTPRTGLASPRRSDHEDHSDGLRSPYPAASPVENPADEVQQLHPAAGPGCNQRTDGVQPAQPRGAAVAPEPSREPSKEPPAATARAQEAALAGEVMASGGPAGEFFAALGTDWRLTATQRLRLTPAVTAAPGEGWTPNALAANQVTRMLGFDSDAPRPCPRCKPVTCTKRGSFGRDGLHPLRRA
jgi:hypothetical protein